MNKNYFRDKVIIITGSNRGIGLLLAEKLLQAGARVVINGRNPEKLEQARKSLATPDDYLLAVKGDVTDPGDCKKLLAETLTRFDRLDILINNAGVSMNGYIQDLSPDVFKQVMDTNYLGSVYPTLAALPEVMRTRGSILFISSVAGLYGFPRFSAYSASKIPLTSFSRSLKIELTGKNVHVGISYVSFVENGPGKKIMDADGRLIDKPELDNMKYHSPELVVKKIMKQLTGRKFVSNYSLYGRLIVFMKFMFPGLLLGIMSWAKRKGKV
jgi:NAD(P)-dependent dehydrogenase (short-subunit alcohol dehydrogenase family)